MGILKRKTKIKFNGGVVTKNATSREDVPKVQNGCEVLNNFIPILTGGVTARGGFRHAETISGGLSGVTAYTSSSPVGKLARFAFETEDKDISDGQGNVYLLAVLWNYSGTPAANLLIFNPSGTQEGTTITTDADGDALPWTSTSIANIRYTQKGDVIYFVDSLSQVMKLERTGSPGSYTFTVKKVLFSESPFDPNNIGKITYEIRNLTNGVGIFQNSQDPEDSEKMSRGFTESVPIKDSGEHNDFVENAQISTDKYFLSYSSDGNHGQTKYDYQDVHRLQGFQWKGQFYVANDGKYTFGVNCYGNADLFVNSSRDGSQVANCYNQNPSQPIGSSEYFGGALQVTNSKSLTSGINDIVARLAVGNISSVWGLSAAWRMEAADNDDGIDSSNASTEPNALSIDSREWFGRMPYQIKITIASSTTFDWEYKRITDVQQNTLASGAWESGGTGVTIGTSVTLNADLDIVDEKNGSSPNYEVAYAAEDMAVVSFSFSGTPQTGEYYLFNVGYERIPLSIFENADPLITDTKYPYTVAIHDSRLGFGGNDNYPFRMNYSQVGLLQNFMTGPNADEAIETDALSGRYDKIQWMKSLNKLLVGTVSSIHAFPIKSEAFSPENSRGKLLQNQSNAFIEPALLGDSLFGVNSSKSSVFQMDFNEDVGFNVKYISRVIEDLFKTDRIKELEVGSGTLFTWNREDTNILFALTDAGKLKSYSFDTAEEFAAWAEHPIGGDTSSSSLNAEILSIVTLPLDEGDRLYALVNRDSVGLTIEYLDNDMMADHAVKVWSDSAQDASFDGGFINLEGVTELAFTSAPSGFWTAWYVRDGVPYWLVQSNGLSYADVDSDMSSESALLMDSDKNTYTPEAGDEVYVGLYFEPVITPLTYDETTQYGSTQEMMRGWDDPFIRVRNTLGKITVERKANSSRSFALDGGDITASQYLDDDMDNVKDISFAIIGSDRTGQLTFRRKTPTPLTLLMQGGVLEFDD